MAAPTPHDELSAAAPPAGELRRALLHLAIAAGVTVLLAGSTYFVSALADFRPWVPGEPVPFATLLQWDRARSGSAGIAAPRAVAQSAGQQKAAIAESLGTAVAENFDESEEAEEAARMAQAEQAEQAEQAAGSPSEADAGVARSVAAGEPDGAGSPEDGQAADEGEAAENPAELPKVAAAAPAPPALPAALRIEDADLKGHVRDIEDPSGTALSRFYQSLVDVAAHDDRRVVIAHYSDSTTALDGITSTARRRLQRRFGDAGHGFRLGGKGYLPYRHEDMKFSESGNWDLSTITRGGRSDDRYGYGGTLFKSFSGAWSKFGTTDEGPIGREVDAFVVFYQAHRRGGHMELRLDDGEAFDVDTRLSDEAVEGGVTAEDRFERVEAPLGPHELRVRAAGHGETRLYGVSLERGTRGVIYDSLGIVGARASRLLNGSLEHWKEQFDYRKPNLLVLQFGGNEAVDRHMKRDWYHEKLTEVVQHMRAASPDTDCLLMAPLDQGERDSRGRVVTIEVVPMIVEVQRQVAAEQGCAFWSTFDAMGGEGAMGKWNSSNPRLGWGDLVHATPKGYEVIGNMYYKALLHGLREYVLAQAGQRP